MSGVQVVHLATLQGGNHRSLYAVRVRVVFVVLERRKLIRAVVKDVESSAGTGPTYELDLILHGRWQNVLQSVRSGSLLCLQCPCVRVAADNPRSSTLALHLDDYSSSKTPSRAQAVRFLNDLFQPTYSVTFDSLPSTRTSYSASNRLRTMDERLKEPPHVHRKRQRDDGSVTVGMQHSKRTARSTPHGSSDGGSTTRNGNCKKIADVVDSVNALLGTRVDVFGILTDARAACPTRGTGFRSEICLADESSYRPGGAPLKTVQVFTFEDRVKDAIPFRAYGDIVRVRRGIVERYIDKRTATTTVQLNVKFYATVFVWQYDTDSFQPCLSRKALNKSTKDITHSVPLEDQKRVHELRQWVRNFIHRRYTPPRDYIYTIPEVLHRVSMADESAQVLDIVARVRSISEEGPKFCMRLTDGLRELRHDCQIIELSSHADVAGMERTNATKLYDFYYGWGTRPRLPAWVFLKNVRVVTSAGKTVFLLRVDRFTSTILFLDDNAPLVRLIKQQYANIRDDALPANDEAAPSQNRTDLEQVDVPKRIQVRPPCGPGPSNFRDMEACHTPRRLRRCSVTDPLKMTQTEPLYDRIPLSNISQMIFDINSGKKIVHRLLVSVVACTYPRNLAHGCRPVCQNCKAYVHVAFKDGRDEFHCDNCEQTFDDRLDSRMCWKFAVRLRVDDSSGRAVELWIEGNEGEKFFECVGDSVRKNGETNVRLMRRILNVIIQPRHVLECCVLGYKYTNVNDIHHVAGKVVGTKLVPRCIDKNSKETVSEN